MRIRTVSELREELDNLPDDMPIMCVHQSQWPLREVIGGIWVDDGTPEEEESCGNCNRICLEEPVYLEAEGEAHEAGWFRKCYYCQQITEVAEPMPKEDEVAYIVLNGHPWDGTPYGSKRAWSVV